MLEFVAIKEEHEDLMLELTESSFNRRTSANYYKWKYFDNPEGPVIGYAAYDKQSKKFTAYYGVIPEAYELNGKKIKVFQSCDTMTHPDYRRKGLFVQLAELCYKKLEEENELFVKGFAGKESYPGFVKKLGWTSVDQFSPLFKVKAQLKIGTLFQKKLPKQFCIEEFHQLPSDLGDLTAYCAQPNTMTKTRDRAYLEWRLNEPGKTSRIALLYNDKQLVSYAFFTIENELLLLRDIFSIQHEKKSLDWMFNYLEGKVVSEGLKGIYSWSNNHSPNYELLKQQNFIKNPFGVGPMTEMMYFIVKENHRLIDSSLVTQNSAWNLLPLEYDF